MTKFRLGGAVATTVFAGAALLSFAGAGAASAASSTTTVSCGHLLGNPQTDTATLTRCGTATGGSGTIASFVPTGGNVTWKNGTTTAYTDTFTNTGTACPSGTKEYNITGSVTSSTNSSIPTGARVRMTVCLYSTKITNAAGTRVKF